MQENDRSRRAGPDPLADIIRAAGRRPSPPAEHYERVYAASHAVWQRQLGLHRRRRWYPLAAAVALIAIGAALWQTMSTSPPSATASIAVANGRVEHFLPEEQLWAAVDGGSLRAGARIRTGNDGSAALQLAHGGSLRIDSDTEIALDGSVFALSQGTVYFDSAGRPPDMAVEITTSLGTVVDLGTQFEVSATMTRLRVRTRSGEISIVDSPAAQALVGRSGEEIELSAEGAVARRDFAADDPGWSWAEALAVAPSFDTPTVLAYLEWIALETGRRLEFASESVRIQADISRFLGDPAGLTPSELLVTIAATSDFSYRLTPDGSILIGRDDQLR